MSIKVLIVDDSATMRSMLTSILASNGMEVVEAKNGKEGVEKALAETPDVILMDRIMPEMDGLEACNAIRESNAMEDVYIIMLTAMDDVDATMDGLDAGADDYVPKSTPPDELIERIKQGCS